MTSVSRFLDKTTPPHLVTLMLMTGISALSMNVFLPSLPEMAEYFDVDYRVMQLSVALYLGVNAALQIVLGPLSDRFGRRPVLLGSFAVYIVASVGCVVAGSIVVFLAFRMVQAFVVAGMVLSRAVVRDIVGGDKAASMIAYVTMGVALVPMVAPALGGYLAHLFGWQSNFWLQVVLGIGVFVLMLRDLGETKPRTGGSLADQIRAYPELFTSPRFWGYSLSAMFSAGAFYAYLGGAPFVGSNIYGMDSSVLGFTLGVPAIGYLIGNFITGRFATVFGINRMILVGSVTTAFGLALTVAFVTFEIGGPWLFFGMMTFVGLGNGLVLPNANAGMLGVRPALAGSASGLGGAMMIGGGAVIAALVGAFLTEESGPAPLAWMMLISALLAIASINIVIRRARKIGASF